MWRCGLVTVDQSTHTDDAADDDSAHITSAAGVPKELFQNLHCTVNL